MFKQIKSVVLALTLGAVLLTGCGKQELLNKAASTNESNPLEGEWITDCLDMGGGDVNRIYGRFDSGKGYVAILTFASAACSGSYTMTDTQNNSISEPAYSNDVTKMEVVGIPANMYAYSIRQVADNSDINILIYTTGDSFTEFVSSASSHTEWMDWLGEPDVAGFAAAPESFVPTGGGLVLRFNKGVLP